MSQVEILRYEWDNIPWRKLERKLFKLQKQIYQASEQKDYPKVKKLQRLLLTSKGANLIAVRRVSQINRGKHTPGIDGKTALTNRERKVLADMMDLKAEAKPIRRVWIPKPGKKEKRPLGITTIKYRAKQALVKMALEPEWEAKFEPNSYGFRPGRSCHDAIEAIYTSIHRKNAYVLDADISGCFDNINHNELLDKLHTSPRIRRLIKAWLKAGIVDNQVFYQNDKGTPQGGIISPLLANIALHGLENETREALKKELFDYMKRTRPKASYLLSGRKISIIRYADDFVVIHEDKEIVKAAKAFIVEWLKKMGLELKDTKTRICHTLNTDGKEAPGFNFLGFNIRQYPGNTTSKGYVTIIKPSKESQKKHLYNIKQKIRSHRGESQATLIKNLNPVVRGWANYFRHVSSRKVFERIDHQTFVKLWRWAMYRHPHKTRFWIKDRYFHRHKNEFWRFKTKEEHLLLRHSDYKIKLHVKVKGEKSPFDGDDKYWKKRKERGLQKSEKVVTPSSFKDRNTIFEHVLKQKVIRNRTKYVGQTPNC